MRKTLATVGFAALISATPALVPKAHADHLWIAAGAGFRIGNLAFSLVLGDAPYGPDYYWRTEAPIRYPGYGCSDACFLDHGVYYHAASCPLIHHHLHRYGYEPNRVIVRWAPRYRYDYRYDRRYDHRRYDDRRYDRRYDYRRYDRRDRGYHRDDRYDRRRYDRRHRGHDHRYDRRRAPEHHRFDRRHDRRRGDDRRHDGRRHDDRRRDRRHVRPH